MDKFNKHYRSTAIPDKISSSVSEGSGSSTVIIVVTEPKQKTQILSNE